jgi:hypothetical protein
MEGLIPTLSMVGFPLPLAVLLGFITTPPMATNPPIMET